MYSSVLTTGRDETSKKREQKASLNVVSSNTISSPEPSLPLSSGTGKRKSVLHNRILVIPVKLRRREVLIQDGADSLADLETFTRLSSFP